MFGKFVLILSIAVAALVLSASVSAANPIVVYDYEGPDDIFIIGCDGYDVRNASWAKVTVTDYFGKDGNFVREHVWIHISDSIYYNSVFPEIFIQNQGAGNGENISQWWDADGNEKESGMPYRIMLPGIGKLFMMAGHGYWDGENFSWTGLRVFPEDGTGSKLCEVLAP